MNKPELDAPTSSSAPEAVSLSCILPSLNSGANSTVLISVFNSSPPSLMTSSHATPRGVSTYGNVSAVGGARFDGISCVERTEPSCGLREVMCSVYPANEFVRPMMYTPCAAA